MQALFCGYLLFKNRMNCFSLCFWPLFGLEIETTRPLRAWLSLEYAVKIIVSGLPQNQIEARRGGFDLERMAISIKNRRSKVCFAPTCLSLTKKILSHQDRKRERPSLYAAHICRAKS